VPTDLCAWLATLYAGMTDAHRVECRFFAPGQPNKRSFERTIERAARSVLGHRDDYNVYVASTNRHRRAEVLKPLNRHG
jgi:hypothetical protein